MTRRIQIKEITGEVQVPKAPAPLPLNFAKKLDTVARAREWLTNPCSWIESKLFVVKWDGLIPYVSSEHGMRLVREPWDNDLPVVVMKEQQRLRSGGKVEILETEE